MSLAPGYEPHLSVQELSWQMVFARLGTHSLDGDPTSRQLRHTARQRAGGGRPGRRTARQPPAGPQA